MLRAFTRVTAEHLLPGECDSASISVAAQLKVAAHQGEKDILAVVMMAEGGATTAIAEDMTEAIERMVIRTESGVAMGMTMVTAGQMNDDVSIAGLTMIDDRVWDEAEAGQGPMMSTAESDIAIHKSEPIQARRHEIFMTLDALGDGFDGLVRPGRSRARQTISLGFEWNSMVKSKRQIVQRKVNSMGPRSSGRS